MKTEKMTATTTGGGWNIPNNYRRSSRSWSNTDRPKDVRVGCVTTDFAMQNALLQMGLHVLAVNGMLIMRPGAHLRCHGCFKTTSDRAECSVLTCGEQDPEESVP